MKRLAVAVALCLGCGGEQETTAQEHACDVMADTMCHHLAECESPSWTLACRQQHRDWCVRIGVPAAQATECADGYREMDCARVLNLTLPLACEF